MARDPKDVFYVPVALDDLEAVAVKSAAAAVVTSMAGLVGLKHPLVTGMLKIEKAYQEARDKHEASPRAAGQTGTQS
jgi:hypothetical protein